MDWLAHGLPWEGEAEAPGTVGEAARQDVPTCRLEETLGAVRERAQGWDHCLVVNPENIVLGRVSLEGAGEARIESLLEEGLTTYRPDRPVDKATEQMREKGVESVVVTTPEGRLVGVFFA